MAWLVMTLEFTFEQIKNVLNICFLELFDTWDQSMFELNFVFS